VATKEKLEMSRARLWRALLRPDRRKLVEDQATSDGLKPRYFRPGLCGLSDIPRQFQYRDLLRYSAFSRGSEEGSIEC
jgi:hypothetical protein